MTEWYREFFRRDYLNAYGPRNRNEAPGEVERIEALLGMRPGGTYLDLCCGEGRHAIPLAALGYRVVGLDLSPDLIAAARRTGPRGEWVRGDSRRIPFRQAFDGAYCWFSTFGYFADPADDRAVLAEVAGAVRPGGRFLLEVLNPGFFALHPRETKRLDGDGCHLTSEMTYRPGDRIAATRKTVHYPGGETRTFTLRVRIYRRRELEEMLGEAGWKSIREVGGTAVAAGGPAALPRTLRYLASRGPGRRTRRVAAGKP